VHFYPGSALGSWEGTSIMKVHLDLRVYLDLRVDLDLGVHLGHGSALGVSECTACTMSVDVM